MNKKTIILLAISLIFVSCITINGGYQLFRKSLRQYSDGVISAEQYDSIMGKFYTIDTSKFVYDTRIKTEGCYIKADPEIDIDKEMKEIVHYDEEKKANILQSYQANNEQRYRLIKFTDNGLVMTSGGFGALTNEAITNAYGVGRYTKRYEVVNNELRYEYLFNRHRKLYNIIKTATISDNGDTLTFYKSVTIGQPKDRKPQSKEVYIYYDTLTAIPINRE